MLSGRDPSNSASETSCWGLLTVPEFRGIMHPMMIVFGRHEAQEARWTTSLGTGECVLLPGEDGRGAVALWVAPRCSGGPGLDVWTDAPDGEWPYVGSLPSACASFCFGVVLGPSTQGKSREAQDPTLTWPQNCETFCVHLSKRFRIRGQEATLLCTGQQTSSYLRRG